MAAIDFEVWWAKQADLTYDEKEAAERAFNAAIEIMETGRTVPAKRRVQQRKGANLRGCHTCNKFQSDCSGDIDGSNCGGWRKLSPVA
jgi:hypothetical protein